MTGQPDNEQLETRGASDPAVIYLPDQSQPEPPPERPKPGRRTGSMKGRHFGPRPVSDPLDAWLPPTRCTAAQRAAVEAAAQQAGLSLNAFQRQKLCGSPGARAHRSKPGPDTEWRVKMLAALGRSGNNLNQLLRRVNSYDFRGNPELLEMQAAMTAAHAAHRELSEAILSELGV
jgi:hypothetical protein